MELSIKALLDVISIWRGRPDEAKQKELEGLFSRGRPSRQTPPGAPGIYRIRKKRGQIVYIGISTHLLKRKGEHFRYSYPKEEYEFEWKAIAGTVTSDAYKILREKEQEQIAKHSPPDNSNRGGGGRTPRL